MAVGVVPHGGQPLAGRNILLVEDEPLIAIDIATALANAGARVLVARGPKRGLKLAQDSELSAAVVDFGLGDDDATAICECLRGRNTPFMMYSGRHRLPGPWRDEVLVRKPVRPQVIIEKVVSLLRPAGNEVAIARRQRFVRSRVLDPPRLAMLGQVFDAVLTEIRAELGSNPDAIKAAQEVLASTIIDLAWDDQFGAPELTRIAGRLMRNFLKDLPTI